MPIIPPADRSLRRAYGRDPRVSGVCAGESATGSYYSPRDSHCLSGVWPLPMFESFQKGWPSLPAPKREEIAQFLRTTREQQEALQVELAILDVDTWRIYSQEGQTRSRRAELTRSRKGEDGKDVSL